MNDRRRETDRTAGRTPLIFFTAKYRNIAVKRPNIHETSLRIAKLSPNIKKRPADMNESISGALIGYPSRVKPVNSP